MNAADAALARTVRHELSKRPIEATRMDVRSSKAVSPWAGW